ncbi:MAG: hypothetical protein ACE5JK_06685 [Candidatus Omnitrophota bacterium]
MSKSIAILNSGTDEITAVAARWMKSGDYLLEGFSHLSSRGMREGVVTDATAATDSISRVLENLKERSGRSFSDVYTGISSASVDVTSSQGVLLLSRYGRQINEDDIRKCIEIGSTVKMPLDREALHYLVDGFSIDGESSVKNPLNLEGVKLSARMNIITMKSSPIKNVAKCISMAGYVPSGFVFSGLAASYRILEEEDKEEGVILLVVGADTTEALIFHNGILRSCRVFPAGVEKLISRDENVDRGYMGSLVSQVISLPGWNKVRRVVVTGRGAMIDNIVEALEESFNCPTEIGTFLVKPFEELPPERMRYLGNIGILDCLREEKLRERRSGSLIKRGFGRVLAFLDRYF